MADETSQDVISDAALPPEAVAEFDAVLAAFRRNHSTGATEVSVERIIDAASVSASAHRGQTRLTGAPYVTHPVAVAHIIAEQGGDEASVAAALLHDVVEDTDVTLDDVRDRFGAEIAMLVEGLTKLDGLKFATSEAAEAAEMRRMIVALAADLRVVVVKLADRLHNMRTLEALEPVRATRIAQETLDVYAPLAHRMGMSRLKGELEDLAFRTLNPRLYQEIVAAVAVRAPERDRYIDEAVALASARLEEVTIHARVEGRAKNLYSTYKKMTERQRPLDEIWDLVGMRVVCESVRDCYGALGALHSLWPPIDGRFKDYIAQPRFGVYRSLHATVIGPDGHPLEIQIRTEEMHVQAEWGAAAHWAYKEGGRSSVADNSEIAWVARLSEQARSQDSEADPAGFLTRVHDDLEAEEVYVFSPKGRIVALPSGSTPIDFAYAIHTEIGHRCVGSRVNGRLVPLSTKLTSGDRVEVVTRRDEGPGPSPDWLNFVATHRARSKIRATINRSRRAEALEAGKSLLARELKSEKISARRANGVLEQAAYELGYTDRTALALALGESRITAARVVTRCRMLLEGTQAAPTSRLRLPRRTRRSQSGTAEVQVEGLADVAIRLAPCCHPVPGDEIIGYVGRAGSVAVHQATCSNHADLKEKAATDQGQLVPVSWQGTGGALAAIELEALDRPALLADVTRVFAEHDANIISSQTTTGPDMVARERFEVALAHVGHLEALMAGLRSIDHVYGVRRVGSKS